MIAQSYRFRGHRSVGRVHGKVLRGDFCRFHVARNSRRQDFRMAVVVSKKIAKSAVVRNRIRRRVYEYVRQHGALDGLPVDVVCIVSDVSVADLPAEELHRQLEPLCRRIRRECTTP